MQSAHMGFWVGHFMERHPEIFKIGVWLSCPVVTEILLACSKLGQKPVKWAAIFTVFETSFLLGPGNHPGPRPRKYDGKMV